MHGVALLNYILANEYVAQSKQRVNPGMNKGVYTTYVNDPNSIKYYLKTLWRTDLVVPVILLAMLWLCINTGPYTLKYWKPGFAGTINYFRAYFPLIVFVLSFMRLLQPPLL